MTDIALLRAGNRRAMGRAITSLEREAPESAELLRALHPFTGRAHVVGVTGAPGTGKSTLVDKLIVASRRRGLRVGVIAVDPSSPYSGGAILGDRIRMGSRATDPGVFIRSMATRGALGGVSSHTLDAIKVLDAAGCDMVFVETVGVGQAEVDIVRLADTVLVVLVPNLGDDVQAVKAGLMEIADVFVINKADLGADRVAADVEANLMLAHPEGDNPWTPPILRTIAESGEGIEAVMEAASRHRTWSEAGGEWSRRRRQRTSEQVRLLLHRWAEQGAFDARGVPTAKGQAVMDRVAAGELSPMEAARILAFK